MSPFRSSPRTLLAVAGACLCALLAAASARAVSLRLDPASLAPLPGDAFSVDLVIEDLGGGDAGTVGGFDVALAFDPSAVSLLDVAFGEQLGTAPGEAIFDAVSGTGSLELAGLSLLSPAALDALQPGSFRLATIAFRATGAQPSTIAIDSALIADALGRALPLETLAGAEVSPIPEPQAALLFAAALAVALRAARRA